MTIPAAAVEHQRTQRALVQSTVTRSLALWRRLDPTDLDRSWRRLRLADQLLVTVGTSQMIAAGLADPYLDAVLDEQGIDPTPDAALRPRSFAGTASDGRPLDSLLYEPVIAVKARSRIDPPERAFRSGEAALARIVATQIQDITRMAVGTAMQTRRNVTGWVRVMTPPSCSRCALLAGKVYRTNAAFDRHPGCDCGQVPGAARPDRGDPRIDTDAYFAGLSEADQDRYFTKAGAQAIRDGADIGQVVNARRGMYTAGGRTLTREGTTRRGFAGRRAREQGDTFAGQRSSRYRRTTQGRAMPETLYQQAGSRAEAVELLKAHGFIV